MRRILLVLTVAALMAAMMVSAGPAKANETNFESGIKAVQIGDSLIVSGDDDFGDNVFGDNDFGGGDIDDAAFLACFPCNFDEFDPRDVDINV